ncbi:uncharacterized protein KIAA1671 homolog isoform X2 [Acanthochromis polyacanthus]|uniref:uncharacterized protein KIAA1671 homolog isoform X2 n=1 Tax=Acanthochromis polyacanthus TaxID=80966 RepID=UPI002233F379|nr:uncharacterized protein KIAA1671 homolog isoform X2 [Acanthochromis polyacanthus]
MQYLGGKLSAAQLQVAGWVGSVRRSLHGALELVWGPSEEKQDEEEDDQEEEEESGGGRFQRAMSPLRSFARRSRRSLRRFSVRSRQTVQRRTTETCSVQVNSFSITDDHKDTDALISSEPDLQDRVCELPSETGSSKLVPDRVPDVSPEDVDTTDLHKEPEFAPFPENSTPLLDTSAQRSRADLGKRRIRSRPSRSVRTGMAQTEGLDWRAHDSTDPKEATLKQRESDSEEDQPPPKTVSSLPPASHRVPVFPGVNPAALLARRKKRTSEGATLPHEEKAREEKEIPNEEAAPSPSQLSRSPRSAAHLAGAARVLPPIGGKDGGAISSPAWLKELKSKKRMSQHGGDS